MSECDTLGHLDNHDGYGEVSGGFQLGWPLGQPYLAPLFILRCFICTDCGKPVLWTNKDNKPLRRVDAL